MKIYQPADIRNMVVVGHSHSGKTTLSESMLFLSGAINRQGKTSDGTSNLDHTPEETKRKAGIYLSLAQFESNKKKMNLLDAPGYADFIGEVYCGLRAADFAVLVVNGQNGVEPDTDRVTEILDDDSKPRFIVINMMDKENADFDKCMTQLNELVGNKAVPLFYPIGSGPDFAGVAGVLDQKGYATSGKEIKDLAVPADVAAVVEDAKAQLTETAAEADDELLEKYLETMELSEEELLKGLRTGIANGTLYPVIPLSAETGQGVAVLLKALAEFGPNPLEVTGPKTAGDAGEPIALDPNGTPAGFVFKVTTDLMQQKFDLIRCYSGTLEGDLYNTTRESAERLGQLYNFVGKERTEIEKLVAGDMAAAAKLKVTGLGDTLSDKGHATLLAPIPYPYPVHEMTVAPKSKGDEEKLGTAFNKLKEEDATFILEVQAELHQQVLRTMGDQHMDVLLERLHRKSNIEVVTAKPKVPFRETIRGNSDVQYRHKKQTGGSGQFADVSIKFEARARGEGFEFVNEISGGVIPSKFIPAVEKGLNEAMVEGVLAGYQVVDVRARLHYGGYHDVDSSEMAFKIAAVQAFKKGMTDAQPVLLEPILVIEVKVPEEFMGDVMGDISGRRGKIQGMEPQGKYQVIKAMVPQVELHRYSTTLRSMSQGRARYGAHFSHYEEVPRDAADKLIEALRQEKQAVH